MSQVTFNSMRPTLAHSPKTSSCASSVFIISIYTYYYIYYTNKVSKAIFDDPYKVLGHKKV